MRRRGGLVCLCLLWSAACSSPAGPTGPPPPTNAPPVIRSIMASVSKIEIDQAVVFTAVVDDAESPASQLGFTWSSTAGTFAGTGTTVTWRPLSTLSTPANPAVTLTVSEDYPARNPQGQTVTNTHRVTGSASVRVHNSPAEVAALAKQFLEDFSRQIRPPETVVRDFRPGCGEAGEGKARELADVINNQTQRQINQWTIGTPQVSINYGGICPHRNRRGDACALVAVDWRDTQIVPITDGTTGKVYPIGTRWHSYGTDQVTAEYHENRWWLCDSDFVDSVSEEVPSPTLKFTFARLPGSFFKK
jgi:hypothetical protein